MNRYSFIVSMVLMTVFNVDTNAQSHLVTPGQSGTIMEAFLGTYDNRIASGLSIGHSINATLGLGLQGMWVNNNGRPGFKSVAPSVSYVFLNQEKLPLNFQVKGEYLYKRFTKIDTLSHHIGRFAVGAFRRVSLTQHIVLIPLVQGGIDLARYTYDLTHESERLSMIGIQCPFIIRNLAITPAWEHSSRTNTFLISIGWIFRSAERIDSFE
jgi:hypothetical protein